MIGKANYLTFHKIFFCLNDSVKKNISFGINEEDIDEEKLFDSIKNAELEGFIKNLPLGVDAIVGEKGINISGGQKQRIGIARALYRNKAILILDEASSALDYATEKKIMKNIYENFKDITLICITHRIENLKDFDKIINLNEI